MKAWTQYRDLAIHYPTAENAVAGTISAGSYTDLKEVGGTTVNISEVAAAPGYDYRLTFGGVGHAIGYAVKAYYNGNAAHEIRLELYDEIATAWVTLQMIEHDARSLWHWYSGFIRDTQHLSASNVATMRFYHYSTGNGAHDLYIDYAALISEIATV